VEGWLVVGGGGLGFEGGEGRSTRALCWTDSVTIGEMRRACCSSAIVGRWVGDRRDDLGGDIDGLMSRRALE